MISPHLSRSAGILSFFILISLFGLNFRLEAQNDAGASGVHPRAAYPARPTATEWAVEANKPPDETIVPFAVFSVTNTNDSGAGSLRQALTSAVASTGPHFIDAGGVTGTISLQSALPTITNTNITINGPTSGTLTITRGVGTAFRIFTVTNASGAATLTLNNLTMTNGSTGGADSGGGIRSDSSTLNLNYCTISGCVAENSGSTRNGGGLFASGNGTTVNINFCTFTNNQSDTGGGISVGSGAATGTVTINNTTISGNQALTGNAGGIQVASLTANLNNCTISGNTSASGGGGMIGGSASTVNLRNCTVTNNTGDTTNSGSLGGGIRALGSQTFSISNTIVTGNFQSNPPVANDITWSSAATNKTSTNSTVGILAAGQSFNTSTASFIGNPTTPVVVNLGALANNGGPTQTHALLVSSPERAINLGSNTLVNNLASDQRGIGFNRISGGTVDMGAVESGSTSPSFTGVTPLGAPAQNTGVTTLNYTVPPGTNRLLVVTASNASNTAAASVSFAGTGMTLAIQRDDTFAYDAIFVQALGTSGSATSGNVVVTGFATAANTVLTAQTFQNVNQTTPIDGTGSNQATGANLSSSVTINTTTPGDLVFDIFDCFLGTNTISSTPGAGQAAVHKTGLNIVSPGTGFGQYTTTAKPATGASTSTSWTSNTEAILHLAANINQATAGTTVSSINRVGGTSVCSGASVSWTVTFAASVTGLTTSNFALANTGLTSPSITGVSGSGTTWTVTASTGSGSGSLGLNMANATGVTPTVTNLPFTGQVFTVNANPTVFNVTGGGSFCSGGTGVAVGLSGSQTGVNYQLILASSPVGSPVAGTGAAISFGNQTSPGTYTVVATNATTSCTANMTGSATVNLNPTPGLFTVTGGGSFCSGGTGVAVGLSGSQTGVNYQLFRGASPVGSPVAGTGLALNFGNQTTAGTYTVVATNATTSCTANMTGSAVVTVNSNPTVFNVTGGGTVCSGGPGVAVGLNGSQSGVNYQLFNGASPVGSPVAGTGSALNFGLQTAAGTYTVTATNATTSCTANMTGSAVVTVSSLVVTIGTDSGAGSLRQVIADACAGSTITFQAGVTTVMLTTAELAINKNLTIDGGAGVTITRQGGSPSFRIFNVQSGNTVSMNNLTVTNGSAPVQAGGIQNSGTLTLTNCAISGNTAPQSGGIQNDNVLTMTGCTISGNTGTIFGGGLIIAGSTTTLTNCTISGNIGGSDSGGIGAAGTVSLTNCTVANNQVTSTGGGMTVNSANVTLRNTIFAQNTAPVSANIDGTVNAASSNNLVGVGGTGGLTTGVNGNLVGVANPLLGTLGSNGGPTQTIALLPGSPAINAGTNTSAPSTDQRGIARPQQTTTDIGAFESRGFTMTLSSGNNQSAPVNTAFANPLAVTVSSAFSEPVNGGRVTFTPPGSGASATIAGNPATIASGTATTGTVTANGTLGGPYTVAASANGVTTGVNFSLTNGCPSITVFNVTGGGSFCATGPGVAVGLSGSQTGVNYQLFNGASPVGSPVVGTGSALNFGNQTTAGTYTVGATNTTTGCSASMTGSAVVTVNPTPTAFNVTGGGSFCSGGTGVAVGLSGSQTGVNYQLFNGASPVGSPVVGTGSALNFGNQTTAGTYTVGATNTTTGCSASMTGNAVVTLNPTPTAFNVTGGGSFCSGGTGVAVGLSGSQTGVDYQLFNGASPVGSPVAGTGSAISFGNQTTAGTYTVVATNAATSCTANMTGNAVVTVNPTPTAFNVTGGGSFCSGGSGVAVGLSGSQTGVDYQLFNGASPVGSPVAGTGSAISFGNQTTSGTYTVVATNATTSCTANMTGSATVTVTNCAPTVTTSPATGVTTTGATLNGSVNANGDSTTVLFRYGTTAGGPYPNSIAATPSPVTGTTPTAITATVSGLLTNQVYYFIAEGTNGSGTTQGLEQSFSTAACTYALSASSANFPASGGNGSVTITTTAGCAWNVSGIPTWISNVSPASGTGTTAITFTVAPNQSEVSRSATLTIGGESYTVNQSAAVAINSLIGFSVVSQSAGPPSCSPTYANDYFLVVNVTNNSAQTIYTPYFQVVELQEAAGSPPPAVPFRLVSADGATCSTGGLVGSIQSTDGQTTPTTLPTLAPGQSVTVRFVIALPSLRRFRFVVSGGGSTTPPVAGVNKGLKTTVNKGVVVSQPEHSGALAFVVIPSPDGKRFEAIPVQPELESFLSLGDDFWTDLNRTLFANRGNTNQPGSHR